MKPHRIFASIVIAFALMLAAAMLPTILAHAQQPPSKCGAYAVGKATDDDPTVIAAALPRQYVDAKGVWRRCQPWVKDGEDPAKPRPVEKGPPCMERQAYEYWSAGEGDEYRECTSRPAGAYTGQSILRYAEDGAPPTLLRDESDRSGQSYILFRCVRGNWVLVGSLCRGR